MFCICIWPLDAHCRGERATGPDRFGEETRKPREPAVFLVARCGSGKQAPRADQAVSVTVPFFPLALLSLAGYTLTTRQFVLERQASNLGNL